MGFWVRGYSFKIGFSVLSLCCLFFTHSQVYARGQKQKPNSYSTQQVTAFCELLLSSIDPESRQFEQIEVQGAVGLRILRSQLNASENSYSALLAVAQKHFDEKKPDTFYPHEIRTAALYAKHIYEKRGDYVLLVADMNGRSLPGFDGVVFNREGSPIANISLKTISGHSRKSVHNYSTIAIEKAQKFSSLQEWLLRAKLVREPNGRLKLDEERNCVEYVREWLLSAIQLFGIPAKGGLVRPTRVIIEIEQNDVEMPDSYEYQALHEKVQKSSGIIEKIVVLKGEQILEIW